VLSFHSIGIFRGLTCWVHRLHLGRSAAVPSLLTLPCPAFRPAPQSRAGQERREVPGAAHTSCTVEMVNMQRRVDVAVIDEIQMIGDETRSVGGRAACAMPWPQQPSCWCGRFLWAASGSGHSWSSHPWVNHIREIKKGYFTSQ